MIINKKLNWKIFWLTFFLSCLMVTIQHSFIYQAAFLSPLPQKEDILDSLIPKLQQKINTFKLFKKTSFVPKSYAASILDNAQAYVVLDYDTGTILADKGLSKKLPLASLTKIMTAVVALDLASPSENFTAPYYIRQVQPTHIAMQPGETMTLKELLHAALLTSANDATETIKFGINQKYGEQLFIRAMNQKADFLGLRNTHFNNPQGFDNEKNYSSVEDYAVLAHYALTNYPLISEIVKKDYFKLSSNTSHRQHDLYNWNGLLGVYPGAMGIKIGNTEASGYTTAVVAEREGKKVLAVLFGAPGVLERDMWASDLLDLGFLEDANLPPIGVTEYQLREKYSTWRYGT